MAVFIGVWVKLGYFGISLFVWAVAHNMFLKAGIPSPVAAVLSTLVWIATLAVFFQRVRDVLQAIVEAIDKISG